MKKYHEKIDDLKNEINDLEKSKNSMNSNIILNKKEELKNTRKSKTKILYRKYITYFWNSII